MTCPAPKFDNAQAIAEGWILNERSSHPSYAIETLDDPSAHEGNTGRSFTSDEAVERHVISMAMAGSPYHVAAAFFLRDHSPKAFNWLLSSRPKGKPHVRVPAGSRPHA